MHQRILTGRIANLVVFSLVEFGTRASFKIEGGVQCAVVCAVEGNLARKFIAQYREGDIVVVSGFDEPQPSTAAPNTLWPGRFHVRDIRVAEDIHLAA